MIQEGHAARETLILANIGLVFAVARRYARLTPLDLDDLIQEGTIGLIHAVEQFDEARGTRFTTSAVAWIRHAVLRAIDNHGRTVRLPLWITERMGLVNQVQQSAYGEAHDHQDSVARVLETRLGWPPPKVHLLLQARAQRAVPLDAVAGSDSELPLEGRLPAREPSPEHALLSAERSREVRAALDSLPTREAIVLKGRYGFEDDTESTLAALGARLAMTREGIRKIQQRALDHLRHRLFECPASPGSEPATRDGLAAHSVPSALGAKISGRSSQGYRTRARAATRSARRA